MLYVLYTNTKKIAQNRWLLGAQLLAIFKRAAREPNHNKSSSPFSKKFEHPLLRFLSSELRQLLFFYVVVSFQ
jgi:hypothetical protein